MLVIIRLRARFWILSDYRDSICENSRVDRFVAGFSHVSTGTRGWCSLVACSCSAPPAEPPQIDPFRPGGALSRKSPQRDRTSHTRRTHGRTRPPASSVPSLSLTRNVAPTVPDTVCSHTRTSQPSLVSALSLWRLPQRPTARAYDATASRVHSWYGVHMACTSDRHMTKYQPRPTAARASQDRPRP